jgi:hypothetical protein
MLDVSQISHLLMLIVLLGILVQLSGLVKRDLVPYTTLLVGVILVLGSR